MVHSIQRALDSVDVTPHDMGVNFSSLDIGMAHKFLEYANIDPVFKHVRGK